MVSKAGIWVTTFQSVSNLSLVNVGNFAKPRFSKLRPKIFLLNRVLILVTFCYLLHIFSTCINAEYVPIGSGGINLQLALRSRLLPDDVVGVRTERGSLGVAPEGLAGLVNLDGDVGLARHLRGPE